MHYYSPGNRGRWPSRTWRMGGLGLDLRPPRVFYSMCAVSLAAPMRKSGLTKTEAHDLLDWLESNGCPRLELATSGSGGFSVHWWD